MTCPSQGGEANEAIEQLLGGRGPGVNKVCHEFLKALDVDIDSCRV